MSGVNVKSEIKPLKKVLLHRPGKELLNLTPNTLEELLFDDIPFLKVAQEEHDAFAQALRDNGVEVFYLEDLMAEVLEANPELREQFLKQWIEEAGIRTDRYQKIIFDYMQENYPDAKDFVLKTMEGINLTELHTDKSNSLVDLVSESSKMVVAPMPNLYFTRDPFAMIGNGVSINRMYSETRNRETIYGEYIFTHHPLLKGTPEYYSRYNTFHIEGGDILNINDKVLAIGISQRTEPDAIDAIAKNIFNDPTSPIETILAFNIPNSRAFMHLDTVFTQIDYDKCVGCAACTVSCRKKIIVDTYHDLTKLKSTVSFVRCRGGWHNHEVYAKAGATSCREAVKMALDGHCNYGCAGFGDCVKACRFDALEIVQGTAKVNPDKCVGCTACVHVCPQELPVIVPYKGAKMVPCASKDDPEVRKQLCWVGCIGCGDCVDNCPDGLIHLEDGRAVIEPDRCEDCNICSYVCPNGVITAREMPEFTYVQVRAMAAQKGGAAK